MIVSFVSLHSFKPLYPIVMYKIILLFVLVLLWGLMEWHLYFVLRNYFQPHSVWRKIFAIIWFLIPILSVLSFVLFQGFSRYIQVIVMNVVGIVIITKILAWMILIIGESMIWIGNRLTDVTTEINISRRKFLSHLTLG